MVVPTGEGRLAFFEGEPIMSEQSPEPEQMARAAAAQTAKNQPAAQGAQPKAPWEPLYDAWTQVKGRGVPRWFVFHPSCRKYYLNLLLLLLMLTTAVWGWLMPADGFGPWRMLAMITLGLTALLHLMFCLGTWGNRRVFAKMKLLMPHLVLVAACVVVFLLLFVQAGGKKEGFVRTTLVVLPSAIAVIYGLWLLGKVSWRLIGMRYELRNKSILTKRGIFGRTEDETPMVRVNDVSVSRSFTQRLLGLCTVDVISTDPTDVDDTTDELRAVLRLSKDQGVLVLQDLRGRLKPVVDDELKKQLTEAATRDGAQIPDDLFGMRDVDQIIEDRMHWVRRNWMVVVD